MITAKVYSRATTDFFNFDNQCWLVEDGKLRIPCSQPKFYDYKVPSVTENHHEKQSGLSMVPSIWMTTFDYSPGLGDEKAMTSEQAKMRFDDLMKLPEKEMPEISFYAILASGDGKFSFRKTGKSTFEVTFMGEVFKGNHNPHLQSTQGWGGAGDSWSDLPRRLFACRVGQPWVASAHYSMLHMFFAQLMMWGEEAFEWHKPRLVGDACTHANAPIFSMTPYEFPLIPEGYSVKYG